MSPRNKSKRTSKVETMNEVKPMGRMKCPLILDTKDVFFSLVDYRNSRFTSDDLDKIIEFYDSFPTREDLIEWMRERPNGVAKIYEVDGDKDIIVVIPTSDFNGKYARECRDNIFKGLHMVFVESGGKGDFYFNFAYNVNAGVKKALEYNPKWIVHCKEDMKAISPPKVLKEELMTFNNSDKHAILVKDNPEVSTNMYVAKRTLLTKFLDFYNKVRSPYYLKELSILHKFKNKYYFIRKNRSSIFYRKIIDFTIAGAFCCYNRTYCESVKGELFDESLGTTTEDIKLGMLLTSNAKSYSFFRKYDIENPGANLLGRTVAREFRNLSGHIALDYQLHNKSEFEALLK